MDMSAISGLLSSLNAAKDIAQAMIGLRDSQAFQTKLLEFQAKLLDAHNCAFAAQEERAALLEQVSLLKEEVAHLKDWNAQKERYELQQIPSHHKPFAYALKPGMEEGEPPHYICTTCYENGKRSILQPEAGCGITEFMVCHNCWSALQLRGSEMRISQDALAKSQERKR
jgi:hypothetical protein